MKQEGVVVPDPISPAERTYHFLNAMFDLGSRS